MCVIPLVPTDVSTLRFAPAVDMVFSDVLTLAPDHQRGRIGQGRPAPDADRDAGSVARVRGALGSGVDADGVMDGLIRRAWAPIRAVRHAGRPDGPTNISRQPAFLASSLGPCS